MANVEGELLEESVRKAADLIEGLALAADLRAVAFGKVLDQLMPGATGDSAVSDVHPADDRGAAGLSTAGGAGAPRWEAMAQRSGLPGHIWERLVSERDGNVELMVSKSRLPAAAKLATRDVALLVGGARQGLGLDEFTHLDAVRDELLRYGRHSAGHFREYVEALDDVITVRSSDRTFRLLPDGWEALTGVAERLLADAPQ